MALRIRFTMPEKLYVKDPQSSSYGQKLLKHSIDLMDEIGFEAFTFRKLAERMESSEVSVYRYFGNKHLLLIYINCWYWQWVGYLIDMRTLNVSDSLERLKRAIHCMIYASREAELNDYINEKVLRRIIVKEGIKTYHVADVDEENKEGFFIPYKLLIEKVAAIVQDLDGSFAYPRSLCSTIFEMINSQLYYMDHLPRLSDLSKDDALNKMEEMALHFTLGAVKYQGVK